MPTPTNPDKPKTDAENIMAICIAHAEKHGNCTLAYIFMIKEAYYSCKIEKETK